MEETIKKLGDELASPATPLPVKMRDLFTLRAIGGPQALDAMARALKDKSALLRHETAYVMGQTTDPHSIPILVEVLKNTNEDSMVRHEAAEALGAIAQDQYIPLLEEYLRDPLPEVSETCELALDRIRWTKTDEAKRMEGCSKSYLSVDPAPPLKGVSVSEMRSILLDTSRSLWDRYRAMFGLRDDGSAEAVAALCAALLSSPSALERHEIAYVMGQMQDDGATDALHKALANTSEHGMVRHEAAEALGAIASQRAYPILKSFLDDSEDVVRESCEVALDICHHEQSGDFQWADGLARSTEEMAAV